jgi:L-ribulose-5-phosphate 3-epimerase
MHLGYNTNGFAHHRLEDAVDILAELGYKGVALTLDHHHLDPYGTELWSQVDRLRGRLAHYGLKCVVETGARFLLDPRNKHQPTLVSAALEHRDCRVEFLNHAILIAKRLGADAVSFWSGMPDDDAPEATLWQRLVTGCQQVLKLATKKQMRVAFEPEPGMFIDTMATFQALVERIQSPWFGLTLDVGHVHCQDEGPIAKHIHQWKDVLWNVHIEDMRRGVHDHLMFGDGEIDFPPIFRALCDINYAGGVYVELSRHSHDAVNTARRALTFLRGLIVE